jgi:hypothetical protein
LRLRTEAEECRLIDEDEALSVSSRAAIYIAAPLLGGRVVTA